MTLEETLKQATVEIFKAEFAADIAFEAVTINITKKEHEGDFTVVAFPLTKFSKKSPEQTAEILGHALMQKSGIVKHFNVIKGFLNLSLTDAYWLNRLKEISENKSYGTFSPNKNKVVLEYCGPNTNKPLHIGHIRNMLLGFSMSEILKAAGYDITKVNIYNDRGIAVCQSMVGYKRYANGATPQSTGIKGDHFVGDWYVKFNAVAMEEIKALLNTPADKDEAKKLTPIYKEAQDLLLKWEAGDKETLALWKRMNDWVYQGFQETYKMLGVDFQKDYYESETYKLGKNIVEEGLQKKAFYKRADGAVAVDLTRDGLDEKVLLRADGTSIYITQDLATAELRYDEFKMDKMIYVVANEQDYHFKVLKLVLQKLGKKWAEGIYHLSYALVESPTGRFKSREGKTADADDLIAEVLRIAEEKTKELGKIEGFTEEEARNLYRTIGLGALKYFILRVNPYKKIIFNPEESIDFHGNTGPFVQYTHARIRAVMRKAGEQVQMVETQNIASPKDGSNPVETQNIASPKDGLTSTKTQNIASPKDGLTSTKTQNIASLPDNLNLENVEREIIIQLSEFENVVKTAAEKYDPSELANYVYPLAKTYNKFYHEHPILNAESADEKKFRIALSNETGIIIKKAMKLLGIDVPEKM